MSTVAHGVAAQADPAPTFTDDVPEPAFDILSDESGKGARSVVIFRRMGLDVVDYAASPSHVFGYPRIRGELIAWMTFETDDGWSWVKTGGYQNPDCDPLFL